MRLVSGLALAVTAAIVFLACSETQEVTQSDSPGVTASATPTASSAATQTASPPATPTATYEWVPPTPEVSRDDLGPNWYVSAFEDDEAKAKITQQTLNGILIGPEPDLFPAIDACRGESAEYIHPNDISLELPGSVADIQPKYLPTGVNLDSVEASECQGEPVNVVKRYLVESRPDPGGSRIPIWSGGSVTISRTVTSDRQFPVAGVAERLRAATIGGNPAIVAEPLTPLGYDIGLGVAKIVISDGQTMTSVTGQGLPFGELLAMANSLWES